MKFTLSWLKDHLQTEASLDEIASKLTLIGLEVEGIEDPAARLKDFTIARVLEAEPHPNADKLRVCKVETSSGVVQVVCGAPNARRGLIGVFAAPGTYVPGIKTTLGKATIRGVDSRNAVLRTRAGAFRGTQRHHRAAGAHEETYRRALRGRHGAQ